MNLDFKSWLNERGISDSSIERYGISGDSERVVIPVNDREGKLLFNKYRILEPKKYLYDKGATVSLFGIQFVGDSEWCVLTEGELDAVRLDSIGIPAVSGTSGCGCFREEWIKHLPKSVLICYDSDSPGKAGANKIHWLIPGSRIIQLPEETKDVTDYLRLHTKEQFLELIKKSIVIPKPLPILSFQRNKTSGETEIELARSTPIDSLLKFSHGAIKCIWHTEKEGSLHYYKDSNHVFCFGCSRSGDAIDVYMTLHNVSFRTAVNELNNNF